jgi:hypothetical protein
MSAAIDRHRLGLQLGLQDFQIFRELHSAYSGEFSEVNYLSDQTRQLSHRYFSLQRLLGSAKALLRQGLAR